jgi:hypothetical protein
MKKTFQTILFTIMAVSCFPQIPNSGFESWTNMGSYENPDSWGTMNNTTASSAVYTATKGSPGNPGSAYLKLTSATVGPSVVNAIAVSGVLDSITKLPKLGFPFSQRPQSFTGKWQHMIFGSSQGSVSVFLTRWNSISGQRDTVAMAKQTLAGMAMSWASFTIDFVYQSGEYPDTSYIILQASGSNPSQADYLWVDDLGFSGSVAGIQESNNPILIINCYPNPANNEIEFSFSESLIKGGRLIISDMTGNEIFAKNLFENSFKINTSCFADGIYFFELENNFNVRYTVGKFIVQH